MLTAHRMLELIGSLALTTDSVCAVRTDAGLCAELLLWAEASLTCCAFLRLLLREPLGGLLVSALLGASSKHCPGTGCRAVLGGRVATSAAGVSGAWSSPFCRATAPCLSGLLSPDVQ